MMNSQTVIIVNFVTFVLIRTVGYDLENDKTRRFFGKLKFESTFSDIRCFEHTAEIFAGLDVFEDHL